MKIYKVIFLVTLGLLLTTSTCFAAWTIDNGIGTGSGQAMTAYDPSASPVAGTYTSSQSVSLSASGSDSIRYTIDGSTPSCSSGTVYSAAITVGSTQTIKAISCYDDNGSTSSSNVASHAYTINISSGGSSGGGGGGMSVPACTSVVYSVWGTCSNSLQFRNVLSRTPSSCSLTTSQQVATSQACTPTTTTTIDVDTITVDQNVQAIILESKVVFSGVINNLLTNTSQARNQEKEVSGMSKYTDKIVDSMEIEPTEKEAMNNFIVYGTATTKKLGAGERAGVVNSYKAAFGKLPKTESEWSDVIKIGNGRWPSQINAASETNAEVAFLKIYLRAPDRTNPNDDAAVVVIAYGLRPADRNLDSEKAAIKTFNHIYGYDPVSATAWDIVRAIAYSGATR